MSAAHQLSVGFAAVTRRLRKVEQLPQPNNRNFYLNCLAADATVPRVYGKQANRKDAPGPHHPGTCAGLRARCSPLEAIRTADPDVMLLDWDMPVLNGIEVLRIVRSPGVFPRPTYRLSSLPHARNALM
jgi:hypothetical protein